MRIEIIGTHARKIRKSGGSLVVALPKHLCDMLGRRSGDEIEIALARVDGETVLILKKRANTLTQGQTSS